MMGMQVAAPQLFYDFCLDDYVPGDHLLRRIDRFVDLESVRAELRPFYSTIGRPSIDPDLMLRMLIVGYCMGIRSERRLCEEVHLNLAYRWFCRLGLDGKVPDHSTFSRNRHGRFRESDILRRLFETVVERCLAEGLVGGDGFAVDASLIAADANKHRSLPSSEWKTADIGPDACRAAREYLATLDDAAFGAASDGIAEVRLSFRSGGAMDRRPQRARLLRLRDELPDRPRPRDHCRCGGDPRNPAGRGRSRPNDDRSCRRALWPLSGEAGRRSRLWVSRDAGLACS